MWVSHIRLTYPAIQLTLQTAKLLKLYFTVSASTAAVRHSLSQLGRIKYYLRLSIGQKRLNYCLVFNLCIELIILNYKNEQIDL